MKVVIVDCFDTYEHRVDLLYDYFKNRGDEVHVFLSSFRHFQKVVRTERRPDYTLVDAKPYKKNLSLQRMRSHVLFAKSVFRQIGLEEADFLWVLAPPNSLVRQGSLYKQTHPQVRLVFDFMDLWPETMPIARFKNLPPFTWWRRLRDGSVSKADLVVAECHLYEKVLGQQVPPDRLQVLYLAKKEQPYEGIPKLSESRLELCYLGSVNNLIDIALIGSLFSRITKPITLHLIGDGEKVSELIATVEKSGAQVVNHGRIYDLHEKQQIANHCHYGLNLMKSSVFVGLTMKSMDYFELGLPIINNIAGDTWEFVRTDKIGYNVSETEPLPELLDDQRQNLIMRQAARRLFERELTDRVFFDKMDQVMKRWWGDGQ